MTPHVNLNRPSSPGRDRQPGLLRVSQRSARMSVRQALALTLGLAMVFALDGRSMAVAQPATIDRPTSFASRFIGQVTDLATNDPIAGARVGVGSAHAVTGPDGRYGLNVPPGRYDIRVTAVGYQGATVVGQSVGVSYSRNVSDIIPDAGGAVGVDVGLPPLVADDETIRSAAARLRGMAASPGGVDSMLLAPPASVQPSITDEPDPVPRDVRVLMPDGRIVQIEMDEYLKGVVPVEMGYVFRRAFEALSAQAIASRTYASTSCLPATAGDPDRCERGLDANVDTTTRTQAWGPVHYDITDAAVEATHGQVARLDGKIIQALYFARTVGRTLDSDVSPCCGGRTFSYLRSMASPDPFDARRGHGTGMSQEGAAVFADWGATAEEIIQHYYRGVSTSMGEEASTPPAGADEVPEDEAPIVPPSIVDGGDGVATVQAGAMEFDADVLEEGPALGAHSVLPFDAPATSWFEGPVTEAQFPFMALAARWQQTAEVSVADDGAEEQRGDARLMVRVSEDGISWSEWTPLLPDDGDGRADDEIGLAVGSSDESLAEASISEWTRLLVARGRFAQLRLALIPNEDGDLPTVQRVTLHYLNSDAGPLAPLVPARIAAAGTDAASVSAEADIIPRAGWGADESLRLDDDGDQIWPPFYTAPRAQIVHHTVTANDPVDPASIVRAIYHFHAVTRGWGDIGYNFLVDHRGNVYEGRFGGEREGRITQGGHALQFNSNSIGVALLGTFTESSAVPEGAAVDSLVEVLAAKGSRFGIDPIAPVTLQGTRFDHAVMGHRDALPGHTACPGLGVHEQLDGIRERVVARMADAGPVPTIVPSATLRATRTLAPPATRIPTTAPTATSTEEPTTSPPATASQTPVPDSTPSEPYPAPGGSATPTSTASPEPACTEIVIDGGFEDADSIWQRNRAWFTGWDVLRGDAAMFVGLRNSDPDGVTSYASVVQSVQLPEEFETAELSYYARTSGHDSDRRWVRVFDESSSILALSGFTLPANSGWQARQHDLSDALRGHHGERVRLYFGVINDGDGRRSYARLDDVSLKVCGGVGPSSPSSEPPVSTLPAPTSAPPTTAVSTVVPTAPPTAPSGSPTALPEECENTIVHGGFEIEDLAPWRAEGDHPPSLISTSSAARSGEGAVRVGLLEPSGFGFGALAQRAADLTGMDSATLSFWIRPDEVVEGDAIVVELRQPATGIRRPVLEATPSVGEWTEIRASLRPEELIDGVEVYAAVLNRGAAGSDGVSVSGGSSSVVIDDVTLIACHTRTFRQIFPRLFGRPGDPLTRP